MFRHKDGDDGTRVTLLNLNVSQLSTLTPPQVPIQRLQFLYDVMAFISLSAIDAESESSC